MTKKVLAAVTALAIAAGSTMTGAGTAEAKPMMTYNPTYCILFLPFLCMPPQAAVTHKPVVHKVAAKAKPAKKPRSDSM